MLCLNIRQQNAQISINTTRPVLHLHTTLPQVEMSTEPAKLEIHQAQGQLEIDQTPCRYSIGLKNFHDMARDIAQEGRQAVLDGIARIAEEGDRMAHIENKEDAIVNIARDSSLAQPLDITIAHIDAPIINYHPAPVQFHAIFGKLDITLNRGRVDSDLQRGTVDISIARYQSIRFWTTENKYDLSV